MKNFRITAISFNKKANAFMVFTDLIIDGRNAAIFRTVPQLRIDLENSLLIGENADSDDIRTVLSNLKGGTVSGNILRHNAGDEFVTADGEAREWTKNGLHVEDGFLDFGKTSQQVQFEAIVKAEKAKNSFFASLAVPQSAPVPSDEGADGGSEPGMQELIEGKAK